MIAESILRLYVCDVWIPSWIVICIVLKCVDNACTKGLVWPLEITVCSYTSNGFSQSRVMHTYVFTQV